MREIVRLSKPDLRSGAVNLVTAFGGIGGVETGGIMSRLVRPIASFEQDPNKPILSKAFGAVQDANFGEFGHVTHLTTIQEAAAANFAMIRDRVYWYHGSPVCSNFSPLARFNGRSETETDTSSVDSFSQGIPVLRPRVVTCEQVPGFKDSQGAANLYEVLSDNDYVYQWLVLNMGDYGISQDRLRYWLVAWKRGDRAWRFPVPTRRVGWYEVSGDLPFKPLPFSKLLDGQKVAIQVHLHHYASNTFLIERKNIGNGFKIRTPYEPAPTITRMMFTDKKPGDRNKLVSRHLFMDAMLDGQMVTLNLRHIRRICGFPDWFEAPDVPAIAGVGYGYACSPEFVRLLIETNLG